MKLYLLRFDSLTSQNSGTSIVGSLLASTHYGSLSYRAATRPADYSFPQALLPLGFYWRARRAWIHATLACCIILLHPTVGTYASPIPVRLTASRFLFLAPHTSTSSFSIEQLSPHYWQLSTTPRKYLLSYNHCHDFVSRPTIVATNERLPVQQHSTAVALLSD